MGQNNDAKNCCIFPSEREFRNGKKMTNYFTSQNAVQQNLLLTNYLPAVVRNYESGSRIEYWVENPETRQLVRKRIRLQKIVCRFSNKKDARRYVDSMVRSINLRLAAGWNPLVCESTCSDRSTVAIVSTASVPAPAIEVRPYNYLPVQAVAVFPERTDVRPAAVSEPIMEAAPESESVEVPQTSERSATLFKIVSERYFDHCERTERKDSLRSVSSFLKIFGEWLDANHPHSTSGDITKEMVVRFMEHVELERKGRDGKALSANTYNNYRKCGGAFFTWMVEKCYCSENHFHKIKAKKKEDKVRILIPEQERQKISEYLERKNPHYLLFLKMIYYALIRPKELRMLKVSDLSFAEKRLTVPKEVAKNHHERKVPLPQELLLDFLELGIGSVPSDHFLFGEGFRPSATPLTPKVIESTWSRMREKLSLPMEMQTYSLRDTGITDMIKNGIDPLTVQQLADHSSLDVTSIYTKHEDPNLCERLSAKMPSFSSKTDK